MMANLGRRNEFCKNNNSSKNQINSSDKNTNTNPLIDPCNLYSIAVAITLLLYKELNAYQLYTVTNLFGIVYYNLYGIDKQIDLNLISIDLASQASQDTGNSQDSADLEL